MGMFDTLKGVNEEKYDSQVKCWQCLCQDFSVGDEVPPIEGHTTYSVRLREIGGWTPIAFGVAETDPEQKPQFPPNFVHIKDGILLSVTATEPLRGAPIFDKWGAPSVWDAHVG